MNADFDAHKEKMKSVLRDVLYSTHCHGCGRQGIPVALMGYMGLYCIRGSCFANGAPSNNPDFSGSWCPFADYGDDKCPCLSEKSPSLSTRTHNYWIKRSWDERRNDKTTWPMIWKKCDNACLAERNPVHIPWVLGPENNSFVHRMYPYKEPGNEKYNKVWKKDYNEWFLTKGY